MLLKLWKIVYAYLPKDKMKELTTSEDIHFLVNSFYSKVREDVLIKHFFIEVVELDFSVHIPKIASFWGNILLGSHEYKGNPMTKHIELAQKTPLEKVHFERWLKLWNETVDEYFTGPKAEEAKERASSIASVMLYKVSTTIH